MEVLSKIFAGLATTTVPFVYVIYFLQVRKGTSKPNPATWLIWFIVMIVNAYTYTFVVGDIYKASIAIAASIMIGLTMMFALTNGSFAKLKILEWIAVITCLIIVIYKVCGGNTVIAHLLLQIILLISFVPTLVGLLKNELVEKALPWILAVLAYVFQIAALVVVWDDNWASLTYPVLNGIIGNGLVALLAIYQNKK